MGLLDPVYNAVNNTVKGAIAGGGAVAGDTVAGVGSTIASTGRGIGDSVTGFTRGWGDYAKDTGNYVKDYTKAPGQRAATAANPLGLGGAQSRAVPYQMPAPKKPTTSAPAKPAASKQVSAAARPGLGTSKSTPKVATAGKTTGKSLNMRRAPSSNEILAHRVKAQMLSRAATSAAGQGGSKRGTSKPASKKAPVAVKK